MPIWKRLLLELYYHGTWPVSACCGGIGLVRRRGEPVMVLMYHRVADDAATPWTVSNRQLRSANRVAKAAVRSGFA